MSPHRLASVAIAFLLVSPARMWAAELEPENTCGVIVGVLRWQSDRLKSFSPKDRKDRELYKTLIQRGVPPEQLTLLLDDNATLKNIGTALVTQLSAARPGSTFIFYYAGHGSFRRDGRVDFCNFDCRPGTENNYFEVRSLAPLIQRYFKGRRVVLLADCCYSGGLAQAALEVHRSGFEAASLTSAERTNASTGNWTFTQTIIDALRGNPLLDADGDGNITLRETASEVADAMNYRELQRHGYSRQGIPEHWRFATVDRSRRVPKSVPPPFVFKQYVWANINGKREVGRIVGSGAGGYTVSLYNYATRREVRVPTKMLSEIVHRRHKAGQSVQVEQLGHWYQARILSVDGDFHYVNYTGWADHWNEWVPAARIKAQPDPARLVMVEWRGNWYPAELLKRKDEQYFISYVGDGSEWDEWVPRGRIRAANRK